MEKKREGKRKGGGEGRAMWLSDEGYGSGEVGRDEDEKYKKRGGNVIRKERWEGREEDMLRRRGGSTLR